MVKAKKNASNDFDSDSAKKVLLTAAVVVRRRETGEGPYNDFNAMIGLGA